MNTVETTNNDNRNYNQNEFPEYHEKIPNILEVIKKIGRNVCQRKTLLHIFPILQWSSNYQLHYLFEDFVAGITVGLIAIPQSIAYAVVAGLQPQYGLYSAFMGCLIYIVFGSCKDITIGPTAIMALMVEKYVQDNSQYAIILCFLSGCIITLFGLLNLGFLVRFISTPVTIGFTSAAAITIASSQINPLLGIKNKSSNEFIGAWENVFNNISKTRIWDLVLGLVTFTALLILRKLRSANGKWKLFTKYISFSRNAIAIIIGTVLAYVFSKNGLQPFTLIGKVERGLPPFKPPPFSIQTNNGTFVEFNSIITTLGSSIIAIPLVSILETIAIAKAFSKGKIVDATQEMIALGLCNILSSFVSSMPVAGSFTRTAVNNASGVRTTLGGLFTAILVLLALSFLAESFFFIPKSVLAAIILSATIFMIEFKLAHKIWKTKKIDFISFIVTLMTCLWLGLEYGIMCGITTNVIIFLLKIARPDFQIEEHQINGCDIIVVNLYQDLIFPSAEYVKGKIFKKVATEQQNGDVDRMKIIVLNGANMTYIDSTVAFSFLALYEDLKLINCHMIFWNWNDNIAGTIWRANKDLFINNFKKGSLLSEVLQKWSEKNNFSTVSVIKI